uniref:F-box domain-containing protein n=1 Tax=Meloidogyne enterolobii TaxID=390850 RepID=A0A6V7YBH3_MELEN|nr:unnamed protein product [Meloidogyne enterolobii]
MFPYEIYYRILKHLPYESLYGSIRLVNHQFSQIASEIIEKNDFGWILVFIDNHDGKNIADWHGSFESSKKGYRSLPECDPPSFIKIERIYFYCDLVTEELVTFLQRMKKVISSCRVDVDDLDVFDSILERSNISMDVFLDAFQKPCYRLWIDQAYSSGCDKFLSSQYVLHCNNLRIQEFIFISDSLLDWLFGEPKITRSIHLDEYSNDCVHNLFDSIKKNAVETPNFDSKFNIFLGENPSFNPKIFEVENKLKIHYFNENSLVFYTGKVGWEERRKEILLESNVVEYDNVDQQRFTKIFIEMEEESKKYNDENEEGEEEFNKSEEEDFVSDESSINDESGEEEDINENEG